MVLVLSPYAYAGDLVYLGCCGASRTAKQYTNDGVTSFLSRRQTFSLGSLTHITSVRREEARH